MKQFSGVPRKDWKAPSASLSSLSLSGKKTAVVGGTGGLGRAIAQLMAAKGAEVTVVGQTFRDEGTPGVSFLRADLSSMKEAQRIGRELPADLDLLLLTAGIFSAPKRQETAEGLERDMAISYLSRIALLNELAPRLAARTGARPRIAVMGFPGTGQKASLDDLNAEKSYDAMAVHMQTVAGNEALVLDLSRRYPTLDVFGLNPGLVKTNIRSNFLGEGSFKFRVVESLIGLVTPTPEAYAERITPLLWAPELSNHSGALFNAKAVAIEPSPGLTPDYTAKLLEASGALVQRGLAR